MKILKIFLSLSLRLEYSIGYHLAKVTVSHFSWLLLFNLIFSFLIFSFLRMLYSHFFHGKFSYSFFPQGMLYQKYTFPVKIKVLGDIAYFNIYIV